ncbi:amino acid adenylation domain-containing protein [Nonomuraea sp. NPDC050536]|uniref:amino acid adenylation domain-containing protein n=1 Tax=Nonomuraea sp. NPDC050536 TaxID=3364366 RepID=UPI0037C5FFE1
MTLHQLVIDAAARYPERPAVAGADGVMRYADLDRRADALAARMRGAGVARGDRVVIWAEKSPEVVAAMQAVLRLGAAYVPVDPATPLARGTAVIRDCAARLVCGDGPRLSRMAGEYGGAPRCLDITEAVPGSAEPVNEPVGADDLAFVLYTSGSTGVPKGVCISHRNARAFVDWAAAELAAVPDDRFANHAGLAFDLSVLDLYAAFSSGAMVHLVPTELSYSPKRLVELLHEQRISVWYSVPSALTLMIREGGLLERPAPRTLRALLFAGEPFPIAKLRLLAAWSRARLLNLYGPTETNVCTYHQVEPADLERDRPAPIGLPAGGDTVWAIRPDGGRAGPGEEGELWVDGPTVMLGYWGREPQRGPYPTGDIARVLPGGAFDYVGRRDLMVKVRGHRVELGDVESALAAHPDVDEAAVVVGGDGSDAWLEAFVVPVAGRAPGVLALKRHSAERLPPYMIANRIHLVAELPRTGNGKVDRAALGRRAHHHPAGGEVAGREAGWPTTR